MTNKVEIDNKLLLAKVQDKKIACQKRNQITVTDFYDLQEQSMIEKVLQKEKDVSYSWYGGFENAERKVIVFYPEKLVDILPQNLGEQEGIKQEIKAFQIILPKEQWGEYNHQNYLGALMKLGIAREKTGDILVKNEGATILVKQDIEKYVYTHIQDLTRFQKAKIQEVDLKSLQPITIEVQSIFIIVPQLRLDCVVSEVLKLSRSQVDEMIQQERVRVNFETKTKNSTILHENDKISIRGKGRFIVTNNQQITSKGKIRIEIQKYV